jgi:hypothetical protein
LPERSPAAVPGVGAASMSRLGVTGAPPRWRALASPVVLAAYTLAAVVGAFLALAPIFGRGPAGRPRRRSIVPRSTAGSTPLAEPGPGAVPGAEDRAPLGG